MSQFRKIALMVTMRAEARPLIERLALQADPAFGDVRLPFRYYRGEFRGLDLLLAINGEDPRHGVDNIGTEAAAVNAYLTLAGFQPELCINAGTAGGFRVRGGEIGDVYLSTEPIRFHDHRIPLPPFDLYGEGHFEPCRIDGLAEAAGLKTGVISTGNALDYTDVCLTHLDRFDAVAKEMEAAGIAWVAMHLGVPFLALKAITDIVDGEEPTAEEFLRNLALASRTLGEKTVRVLEYLS